MTIPFRLIPPSSSLTKCHRWDSNPHYPASETGASYQLGYRGKENDQRKLQESNLPSRSRSSPVFETGPRANGVRASKLAIGNWSFEFGDSPPITNDQFLITPP